MMTKIMLEKENAKLRRRVAKLEKQLAQTTLTMEEQENFASLFQTMYQGVVYQNSAGEITLANPAAERILGLSLAQMQGRTSVDPRWRAIHPDGSDFPGNEHPAMVALQTGKPVRNVVMGVYHPIEDETRWILVDAEPEFRAGETQPHRVYTTFDDITERKHAEESIQQNAQKYAAIFQKSAVPMALTKMPEGVFADINEEFQKVYGYSRDDVIGKTSVEIGIALSNERLRTFANFEQFGSVSDNEKHLRTKSGELRIGSINVNRTTIEGQQFVITTIHDITERKRAEELLRESEQSLSGVLTNSPDTIYSIDLNTRKVTFLNHPEFCGYTRDELTAPNSILQAIVPEDAARVGENWQQIVSQGKADPVEYRLRRKDGGLEWIEQYATVLQRNPDNAPCQILVTLHLNTERKRAEEALQENLAKLEKLIEILPVGISILDREHKVVKQNAALEKILGITAEGLARGDYRNRRYIRPDGTPMPTEEFASTRILHGESSVLNVETGVVKEDEQVVWTNVSATDFPFKDWSMVIVTSDITERKRAEAELVRSEQKFSSAFQQSPAAMTITRIADGKFIDTNEAFLRIFEFTRDQVVGHTSTEINMLDSETRRILIQRQIETGGLHNAELEAHAKSGKIVHLLFSSHPIDLNGEPHHVTTMIDITERKRAEEKLRESEQRYTLLFQKSSIPVFLLKLPEVVIVDANDAAETLTGFRREELRGKTAAELGIISHKQRAEAITQFEKERVLADNEMRILTKSGEERIIIVNTNPLQINGQPFAITSMQDITERKRAEEKLRESEQMFSLIFDRAPFGIALAKLPQGNIVNVNDAWCKLLGYSQLEVIGKTSVELNINTNIEERAHVIAQIQEKGSAHNVEWTFRLKSGKLRLFITNLDLVELNGQKYMLSSMTDITERKRAEEELRKRTEELEQLIDLMPEAIWIAQDPECKDIRGNRFANELLGVSAQENISQSADAPAVQLRQFVNGKQVTSPDELPMQKAARTGQPQTDVELVIQHTGMPSRTLLGGTVPLFDMNGKTRGVVAGFHDITERKQAEEHLRVTLDDLQRANKELEQFAYVASHDLQEPLRAVAGMVQLLQKRYQGQLDAQADEYIQHAVDASTRMRTLINDLLTFSRLDTRGKPFEPTNMNAVLDLVLRDLTVTIEENHAIITHDDLPSVMGDAIQLGQLVQNLLSNSIKYHSDQPPQIHIGVESLPNAWRFSVRDNGIGIKPENFERIFVVFQRLHTRRTYPGTGIGLALCKKIVERHGGKIWVESQFGQGSTFYFTLPKS